jgi:hypothetical protein
MNKLKSMFKFYPFTHSKTIFKHTLINSTEKQDENRQD